MTANESEIGGTPGCNYSDVETETHTQYKWEIVHSYVKLPEGTIQPDQDS